MVCRIIAFTGGCSILPPMNSQLFLSRPSALAPGLVSRLLPVLLLAIATLFPALRPTAAEAQTVPACREDSAYLRGPFGTARFAVELADDAQSRARGLMFRKSLPRSAGMLFVYERPQRVAFWMRNTFIPLDMLFIDGSGQVVKVHSNAVPRDPTPIEGGDNILMVLEINGGLARAMGIAPGAQLRHPSLPQPAALWPCD